MKLNRVTALSVLILGLLAAASAGAQTQAPAEVEIDTSVLQQLSPAGSAGPTHSRPIGIPQNIPQTTQKIIPLSADAPAVSRPYAVRREENQPRILPRQAESFPIRTNTRSDSTNPGIGLTRPAGSTVAPSLIAPQPEPSRPAIRAIAEIEPAAGHVEQRAIERPAAKPAATRPATAKAAPTMPVPPRKPTAEAVLASDAPPLPRRRPDNAPSMPAPKQAANHAGLPPSAVPAPTPPARRSAALDAGVLRNAPKVMPAVPTNPVGAEQLPAVPGIPVASNDDKLLMQLKDFNRDSFVKGVEDVTSRVAAPKPARKPERGGMPPPLAKNNRAIVTPSASAARVNETALLPQQMAALEPAAGGAQFAAKPIDRKPRLPPQDGRHESAFLSVPFMPGDDKASPEIIARLEAEVLPLLRQNPQWRIQIQAFSSPDNDVRSSARRTALSRALSVREYLMEKGIEAPRMDVRALGMETDRDPLDRIDLVFFDPQARS